MVSVAQVSNVLGTVNPIKEIVSVAHAHGVPVMVDGAQSAPHFAVDVQDLDCDFFVFSGHKMYGPTGVGVLYGKEEWLDQLPPYQGGGEMIEHVSFEKTTFEKPPLKFEAGTPDYIASHGLATAIDYMEHIGMDEIAAHERELTKYAVDRLSQIEGMTIYGHGQGVDSDAVVSFNVGNIHHMDMGTLLDQLGIAVRTGHHCAQPLSGPPWCARHGAGFLCPLQHQGRNRQVGRRYRASQTDVLILEIINGEVRESEVPEVQSLRL